MLLIKSLFGNLLSFYFPKKVWLITKLVEQNLISGKIENVVEVLHNFLDQCSWKSKYPKIS